MRALVADHDQRVRAAIENNGGYVFATGGDGFAAAFGRAADAVAAAEQAQAAIADLSGIRVRMGINSGEAQERGGDYFGPAVNRTARLMAAGHGGQVLLAAVTAELVPGLVLRNLGEHRLRDLGSPMLVWQFGADDFPSLRTLDELPGNLPLQMTSFVGRDAEVRVVAERLGEHRLVTLTGVGGVGKTRLALQVAAEVVPEFPDGAWLCELASADDAESLVEVIAASLDSPTRPGRTRLESVIEFLRGKLLLIVLDNCEHVLDPAAELAELVLRQCLSVRVLATSREALAIDGEHLHGMRAIRDEDAIGLFMDRARAVRDFDVDDAARSAIAEICHRLDDIPLAIELAAARVVSMQPAEIAARLDERFRLLSGGRRRGVERHQTLRATVEWSYSMLEERERLVFDHLSVFPGSFTSDAAVSVASGNDIDEWGVIDALTSLARKSMLGTEPGRGGVTRYAVLETLRQYGRERLYAQGEVEPARRGHAAYYAQLAERLGDELITEREIPAQQAALAELDNLRAAVAWSLDAETDSDMLYAVRIVAGLALFANTAKSSGLGSWAERTVAGLDGVDLGLRVAVYGAAAASAQQRGDAESAARYAGLAVAEGIPATCRRSAMAQAAGAPALTSTDLTQSIPLLRKAVQDLQQLGDVWGVLNLELVAVILSSVIGDFDTAQSDVDALVPRARQLGNPTNLVIALYAYACAWWRDNPADALIALEESFSLSGQGGTDVVLENSHMLLGQIRLALGDLRGALGAFRSAIETADRVGNRTALVGTLWFTMEVLSTFEAHDLAAICIGLTEDNPVAAFTAAWTTRELDDDPHARARESTRAALGESRYDQLVSHGGAMSYEDAVAWARVALATPNRGPAPPES